MAQLSRPFQVALGAMVLLALVWVVALRGHSPSSSESGSSAPTPTHTSTAPGSTYKGSAPGVEGLSRDVNKARGAVGTSQQNAKQLQERSARASGESAAAKPSTAGTASSAAPPATAPRHTATTPRATAPKTTRPPATSRATPIATPRMQATVEAELKHGKVVTILFWNPSGTDDRAVHGALRAVAGKFRGGVAVHDALAGQSGSYGSIIRGVQLYGTPTLLIINKHGFAQKLTGYTDAYSIEQAIDEVRHA